MSRIILKNNSTAPAPPAGTDAMIYPRGGIWYQMGSDGIEHQLGSVTDAADVNVDDAGDHYAGDDVEAVLQEIGVELGGIGGGVEGHAIKDEGGSALAQRANLNFTGAGVTASDNSGTAATDITIPGATSGATDLEGLSDVDLTSPATRQGLFYDGTNFVNQNEPGHFVSPELVSATTTADAAERTYIVDASGGARTINLPTAVGRAGKEYFIKKSDSSTNSVTIDPNSSETINGATTLTLSTQNEGAVVESDGANWFITSRPRGGDTNPGVYAGYRNLVTLGSDVSNSTNTYADVTGLSFAVSAGVIYHYEIRFVFDVQATTTGHAFAVDGPSLPTRLWYYFINSLGNTVARATYDGNTASASSLVVTGNEAIIWGMVQPSTSGTLRARFLSEAPGTNNQVTVKAGSTLEYW